MNKQELDAIRERCEKATPGPWYADGWALWDEDCGEFIELHDTSAVANFIAHARTDIPLLLAEIDCLQAERDKLQDRLRYLTIVNQRREGV